jgi:hypothetical protein
MQTVRNHVHVGFGTPYSELLAHRAFESAAVVVARRGKNASARSICIARSAR